MGLEYEQAKAQYWDEREARETAFAKTSAGEQQLADGSFHRMAAEREKPHLAEFKAQRPEHRKEEAKVMRQERAGEGRPAASEAERPWLSGGKGTFQTYKRQTHEEMRAMQRALETGTRGGRYYVSATGQKVYVKDNPGAKVVGHMGGQLFIGGLPASVHLAEPKRR